MIHLRCDLAIDDYDPYIPPEYETGMWFVGQVNTGGDAVFVKGVVISGTQYALVADGANGLQIINITNPESPAIVYNYKTFGYVKEVYPDTINGSTYAFISDIVNGLYVLDISNPGAPSLDTLISYSGGVTTAVSKNRKLYASFGGTSFKIFDLNNLPGEIPELSTYTPVNSIKRIEVVGSIAYFVESVTKIEIVDVSNPASPFKYSTFSTPGACYDIKVADGLMYVADGNAGVTVVNVSNPAQPFYMTSTNTYTSVKAVDQSPNFLFTAEGNAGTEVFNLFNPVYPEAFGYYEPGGECKSIQHFKGKVLVAHGSNGLLILRF